MNEVTLTNFRENLKNYDIERIVRDDNCYFAMNKVDTILNKMFHKPCPIVTRRLKRKDLEKPWVTVKLISRNE